MTRGQLLLILYELVTLIPWHRKEYWLLLTRGVIVRL